MARFVPDITREAGLTRYAIRSVVAAEEAGGGDALGEARRLLLTGDTQSVVDALIVLGNVAQNCDKKALEKVKPAERAARDVVVLHCCCASGGGLLDIGKKAFLEAAEAAFAERLRGTRLGDEENRALRAFLLLAYHKLRRDPQPAARNTFEQTKHSIGRPMPASEFECVASSGASQTELPAYRSGANQHHHHRRHHPKGGLRRQTHGHWRCSRSWRFSACDGCFLPECWRFSSSEQ